MDAREHTSCGARLFVLALLRAAGMDDKWGIAEGSPEGGLDPGSAEGEPSDSDEAPTNAMSCFVALCLMSSVFSVLFELVSFALRRSQWFAGIPSTISLVMLFVFKTGNEPTTDARRQRREAAAAAGRFAHQEGDEENGTWRPQGQGQRQSRQGDEAVFLRGGFSARQVLGLSVPEALEYGGGDAVPGEEEGCSGFGIAAASPRDKRE